MLFCLSDKKKVTMYFIFFSIVFSFKKKIVKMPKWSKSPSLYIFYIFVSCYFLPNSTKSFFEIKEKTPINKNIENFCLNLRCDHLISVSNVKHQKNQAVITTSWKSVTRCFVDWLMKPRKFQTLTIDNAEMMPRVCCICISRRVREG